MNVHLRPACDADREFLYSLHCQTMRPVIEVTWGWDEAWQRQDFERRLAAYEVSIIQVEEQACGGLLIEWLPDSVYIHELQVMPEYQRRGIGTSVLRVVIDLAARRGVPVALAVVSANPGARRLYERLGFTVAGIEPPFVRMERHATPSPAVIRLVPSDAARYVRIRHRMLTGAPWAFAASPDDDVCLDVEHVSRALAGDQFAILAVAGEASTPARGSEAAELVAAAGIGRMRGPKFAHRARLWGVWVEPAHRGRGLGRLVVQAALDHARDWSGLDYVDLGVSERSPEALRLYERLGFTIWGREPAAIQHDGRRYDEIHMTLKL